MKSKSVVVVRNQMVELPHIPYAGYGVVVEVAVVREVGPRRFKSLQHPGVRMKRGEWEGL